MPSTGGYFQPHSNTVCIYIKLDVIFYKFITVHFVPKKPTCWKIFLNELFLFKFVTYILGK